MLFGEMVTEAIVTITDVVHVALANEQHKHIGIDQKSSTCIRKINTGVICSDSDVSDSVGVRLKFDEKNGKE